MPYITLPVIVWYYWDSTTNVLEANRISEELNGLEPEFEVRVVIQDHKIVHFFLASIQFQNFLLSDLGSF